MKKRITVSVSVLLGITVVLNILAWNSESFCDRYVDSIFPIWGPVYGLFTELTDRSVGEIMIAIAAVLLVCTAVFSLFAVIFYLSKRGKGFRRFYGKFMKVIVIIVAVESLVMTLNCFILYHCSSFRDKYMDAYHTENDQYTVKELAELRDMIVSEANRLSEELERDDRGQLIYGKSISEEAVRCMQRLGKSYPQLSGYYSTPKALSASNFFSQQYMEGYYFPFSMEANYNDVMYIVNKPATMCHELAHTKGFIYEDEANFIAYLACVGSDDPFFRYSGYLSVYNYIERDFLKSIGNDEAVYRSYVKLSELAKSDNIFLTSEAWDEVEKKAVLETGKVRKASNTFTDSTLKINGVESGMASYSEVVGLLLDHYRPDIGK